AMAGTNGSVLPHTGSAWTKSDNQRNDVRYAEGIDRGGISGILLACAQIRSGKPQMHHLLDGVHLAVFDLDGTLVDSVPDLAAAVDAALQEVALPVAGEAKVRDWVGNGSRVLIERALADALGEEPGEA